MPTELDVADFLLESSTSSVIDVRSPGEFARGHIPKAHNAPLFTDDERARVGICFKREGREAAVMLGLEIVGPKMRWLAETVRDSSNSNAPLVHCWRGGMRSSSVAWLLEQAGMRPRVLSGGYKSFRRAARRAFAADHQIVVLSGMTGAGKTRMLGQLAAAGEQVLDLEGLANHRGSSFGAIGLPPQPTCEQFENEIYMRLRELDPNRIVWIEDESPSIGRVRVPDEFWLTMRRSPAIFLDMSREHRAANLVHEYGGLVRDELEAATRRLERKLGGQRLQEILWDLTQGNHYEVAYRLLEYYDKTYQHAAQRRPRERVFRISGDVTAQRLIQHCHDCCPV